MLAPFVRTDTGFHYSIDYAELLKFYGNLNLDVWCISSSSALIGWETFRERHGLIDSHPVPCDLFVWGTGQAPDQRLTRIGGTPWLSKSTPWPTINGVVTSFLCQFDFRDSRDLVGNLPGDLLLVFVADEYAVHRGEVEKMRFVWVSADETEIVGFADVPMPTHPFEHVQAWGVRYRGVDLPNTWERAYEVDEEHKEKNSFVSFWKLPVLWATKIGGVPHHSQENQDYVPAGYLCQLVSIQARSHTSWPWVDQEAPLTNGFAKDGMYALENQLMIGDMGEISFYLRDDGSISIESACG